MKQVIVARRDLEMGAGKLAAQVAHAAVAACERASDDHRSTWRSTGQTKVVLGVDDESAVLEVAARAGTAGLPHYVVRDAGRTELEPGTVTCVGVGPAAADAIDTVTGHLSLY